MSKGYNFIKYAYEETFPSEKYKSKFEEKKIMARIKKQQELDAMTEEELGEVFF